MVAAAVAAHYGVSKSQLLDRDAEGAPAGGVHLTLACLHKDRLHSHWARVD